MSFSKASDHTPFAAFVALLAGLGLAACAAPEPTTVAELDADQRARLARMLEQEDRRPAPAEATELIAGLDADVALLRRFAVRGLGRLERPAALGHLGPMLDDPDPTVRAQAAAAIAQSVYNDASTTARELLRARLEVETDATVRGALGRALGRLRPVDGEAARSTLATLMEMTRGAPLETLVPVMRGLESLLRVNADTAELDGDSRLRLVELTRYGRRGAEGWVEDAEAEAADQRERASARVRRLALASLRAADAVDADTVETALYDPDVEVRRLAAAAAGLVPDERRLETLIQIALADAAGPVRYEGLRWYGRRLRLQEGCAPIVAAVDDPDPHVALAAIDLLGLGCRGAAPDQEADPEVSDLLLEIARATPQLPEAGDATAAAMGGARSTPPIAWHRGAHALLALAQLDGSAASPLLPRFAAHPTWQVRMYAARAAGITGSMATLRALAEDVHANVVDAALRGIAEQLDDASALAIAALERDDYQLLITAADVLESSTDEDALATLLETLARVTEQRRETSRDPRLALLERVGELGDAEQAATLRPYLRDFDPRVADLAAQILEEWGVADATAAPEPLLPQPFPTIDELLALDGATARVHMSGAGTFDIELHAFEAPTNVARFARQAREGYLEGLTFHRVVPNFVIQGGSPGANEYVGDGPYTRDELGVRSHLRGTVGISTRGRDTGDGQIFVNLVDNIRLDHNFTLIGTVVSGMETVDAILEGATIERIAIEPGGGSE